MTAVAKVIIVNISTKKGVIKHPVPEGVKITELGIEGDAHAGDWHRQVSLLGQESIDKMTGRGAKNLEPGIFAENITTEGIDLFHLPLGTRLVIGEVELEVTQIGKECHTHCQVYHQVGMCVMPIEGIFTRVKRTGFIKPGDEITVIPGIRVAVVTISDRGSAGVYEDRSGPALVKALTGKARVEKTVIIPDEYEQVKALLVELCDSGEFDVIFTTGGTGFAPRDVTPEATIAVVDRLTPGIAEAIRQASLQITPRAMLSRATAGIRKNTLIVNLPGSPKAAVESIEVFLPVMAHAMEMMRGGNHESFGN
jgi:molybdenum cofactor synthesis domain-containing protein